ncbi:hypothetical protein ACJJIW_20150 [Microbulbifer sp. JMSA004]|nr:hypothetical protein [Microbulbifer sp. VAAF005]WHI46619.1 hypothetical protein P0078_23415 [Microbulbifer sp. VAAF005]
MEYKLHKKRWELKPKSEEFVCYCGTGDHSGKASRVEAKMA